MYRGELTADSGHERARLAGEGRLHQEIEPGEHGSVGDNLTRARLTAAREYRTGLGHVQWLLLPGRGQDLGELVGDVGGGKVEGLRVAGRGGRLVRGPLLATAAVAERNVAEHSTLPTVVPLLPITLHHRVLVVQVLVGVVTGRVLRPVHGDALHVLVVTGAACPGLALTTNHQPGLCASPADCEPLRVIALPPDDLGQDPSSCINKPVANLER